MRDKRDRDNEIQMYLNKKTMDYCGNLLLHINYEECNSLDQFGCITKTSLFKYTEHFATKK